MNQFPMTARALLTRVAAIFIGSSLLCTAAPRDAAWTEVAEAIAKRQPKTAVALLKPLESAAFAQRAWAEGSKALLIARAFGKRPVV